MISAQQKTIFIIALLWISVKNFFGPKIKNFRRIIGNVSKRMHIYNLRIYINKGGSCRAGPVGGFCSKGGI